MLPLYTLTGIIVLSSLPQIITQRTIKFRTWSRRGALQLITFILLTIFTVLPVLLPVPKLSKPGGVLPVGTRFFTLADKSRSEHYSKVDESRRFMIQVWYPAHPKPEDTHAPWMNDARIFARAIASYLELPEFFLDHLQYVKIPAYQDAPLDQSSQAYPIILFSHGWNGFAAQNANQAIELASRGFVVVGIQHTYGAVVTVFPDGKVAYNNPDALPANVPDEEYDKAARILADQWAGDMTHTLDFLDAQNYDSDSPLYASLDLTKIGVYGHSTGGGAAIQFCATNSRCTSLLGMDPWVTPTSKSVLENGFNQPAFFMFSQKWADEKESQNNRLFYGLYEHLNPTTRVIYIRGTSHYDFSDLPLFSPVASQLGLKGPINGKLVNTIVNHYLVAFFEMTLKEKLTDILTTEKSPYPEVVYTR
jgi:predicted dienelactone hydrolase